MTNAEYYTKLETLADQVMVLVRDSEGDRTRIDAGMWNRLCELYRELEDYFFA